MRSWFFRTFTGAAFVTFASVPLHAQGSVSGTVLAAGSLEPLSGANIVVVGTTTGTTTDTDGRFRLTIDGATATLEVRRIGYRSARITARAGEENLRVLLTVNPVSLDQVVVTGTAGTAQKRELGNAVGMINASELVREAPIVSMQSLLNGRTASVVVIPTSGMVGGGQQVRVRGTASLSLNNNPLIYIDGVRVNNDAATGPINQAFGGQSISRLNDLNPADIESIEVLKGPSAATLYGTEASNGVINIITKKGALGAPRWTAMIRHGENSFDWRNRFETNWGRPTPTAAPEPISLDSLIAGNQGRSLFPTGIHREMELGLSGGTGLLTYYLSGHAINNQGVDPNNRIQRYSGRMNLGVEPTAGLRIGAHLGMINGPVNLACEGGCGGRTWTTLIATPANYNNPLRHGFHSMLPYQYDEIYFFWQDLDRLSGSLRVDHSPTSWLQHRANFGIDRTNEGNNRWYKRVDSLIYTAPGDALGRREVSERSNIYRSIDYSANATWDATQDFRFVTSGGAQYYHNSSGYVYAYGDVFAAPGLKSVAATTQNKVNDNDFLEDKTLGVYIQEQMSWRDRLYVTAAIRSDDNSAFGANFNRVTYPKASASWVISEEPWFSVPVVGSQLNSLRLRYAYGQAGKAPATFAALRTYGPASGPGDSPAVTPVFIGNPDLGPEKGVETELGFDIGMLDDRFGVEFTHYYKRTTDAILNRQIAPSIGFSGNQPFNAGAIRNSGTELLLRGTPWRSRAATVDLTLSVATNDNKILSLFGTDTMVVVDANFVQHRVGGPAFGYYQRRVVSAEFGGANGTTAVNIRCDDGQGGDQLCFNDPVKGNAPFVYFGRAVPPREGSFSANVGMFDRWRLTSMLDFKLGHRKIDGNTRVRCTPVIGNRCHENFFPTEYDPVTIAGYQNTTLPGILIADASFTRLRELTLAYDVPERFAQRMNAANATLSLSGRNLALWTKYKGFEPEATWIGGARGGNIAWEQTMLPQLTSWYATLNLRF